jgi:tRNA U34 5-carboxymethylaminomethyl modifying GTPase MnmE/TrmE
VVEAPAVRAAGEIVADATHRKGEDTDVSEHREIDRAIGALQLDAARLSAEETAGVWLLAAAGELLKHCPDASDRGHAFECFAAWAHLAAPGVSRAQVRSLANVSAPQARAEWLIALRLESSLSDALPPVVLVAALLAMIPPGHSRIEDAWAYIDSAANATGVPREAVETIHGWLRAEGSAASNAEARDLLDACAAQSDFARRLVAELIARAALAEKNVEPRGAPPFLDVRAEAIACVQRLEVQHDVLFANRSNLTSLKQYLEQDYFRIVVLGGFNRGKSTLINMLLETRDLLPTSELPSTSALIAVRPGEETRYERQDEAGGWASETRESFFDRAADAAAPRGERDATPELTPRWRVFTRSRFLREQFVELVDTPGVKEDEARTRLAKDEAGRADAALVVLDVDYLSDSDEHELIASMRAKLDRLVIVVNKADRMDPDRWPVLMEHLLQRLGARGVDFPRERVVFVSAQMAEAALQRRSADDPWAARMDKLRGLLQRELLAQSGPLKAEALRRQLLAFVPVERQAIQQKAAARRENLRILDQAEVRFMRAREQAERASAAIERATQRLSRAAPFAEPLIRAFESDRAGILDAFERESASWPSTENPLTSPRKYVDQTVGTARDRVKLLIERWFEGPGAHVLQGAIEGQFERVRADIDEVSAYLQRSGTDRERSEFAQQLRDSALLGLVDEASRRAATVDAFGRSVLVAVGALVAGYFVADVVLFYVLGAIAGFLALPLLVAALVVGITLGATKGREYAERWVRSKICEEVRKGFEGEDGSAKLREGIEQACRDLGRRLGQSFRQTASALVDEATRQAEREREVYESLRSAGDRSKIEAEARVGEEALRAAERELYRLDAIARALTPLSDEDAQSRPRY